MAEAVAALTLERIGKTFVARDGSPLVALDGVDLVAGAGEFIAIVGPSGCGKSTLLDLIAGLAAPSTGRILRGGRSADQLRGASAYMPQRDLLMPWRTVLDNAALGPEVAGVPCRRARAHARAALARAGLAGFERAWPDQLSGGMRQRAALLRTFLCDKRLLLLDEPFGALDALTRQAMQHQLLDLWAAGPIERWFDGRADARDTPRPPDGVDHRTAERTTVIFVTHDVEEAVFLADRVYVLSPRPGRVLRCVVIDLPRPRDPAITLTPHFLALRRRVLEPLYAPDRYPAVVMQAPPPGELQPTASKAHDPLPGLKAGVSYTGISYFGLEARGFMQYPGYASSAGTAEPPAEEAQCDPGPAEAGVSRPRSASGGAGMVPHTIGVPEATASGAAAEPAAPADASRSPAVAAPSAPRGSVARTAQPAGQGATGVGARSAHGSGGAALRLLRAHVAPPLLFAALVLGVWQVAVTASGVSDLLLPPPAQIARALWQDRALLTANAWVTLQEILIGYALAFVVGCVLGVILHGSRLAERAVYPWLVVSQAVPTIAVAPIFVLWTGFDIRPKVLVIVLVSFFPLVVNTIAGLRALDPDLVDLLRAMGATRARIFRVARLPAALPSVFAGLKVAATLAVVGAVFGEWVGASSGLGYLILTYNNQTATADVFAAIAVLAAIGIALFAAVTLVERALLPWRHAARDDG